MRGLSMVVNLLESTIYNHHYFHFIKKKNAVQQLEAFLIVMMEWFIKSIVLSTKFSFTRDSFKIDEGKLTSNYVSLIVDNV